MEDRTFAFCFTVMVSVAITGAHQSDVIYPSTLTKVVEASNNFCFSLYQSLPSNGNIFFSPFSVTSALAMVYLGARGDSASEMEDVLSYKEAKLSPQDVHQGFSYILHNIQDNQAAYDLQVANALLLQQDFDILNTYKEQAESSYNATVHPLNFVDHSDMVVRWVNAWAAWKTGNKIQKVLEEPLSPLTKLFFLNAVYFKGAWKTRFDQRLTMPDTFYNEGKVPKTVPMMRIKKKFLYSYVSELQSYGLQLPFEGSDLSMVVILPEQRDGLEQVESQMNLELLQQVVDSLREVTLQVTIPRFNLDEEYDLSQVLQTLGLKTLFDADKADLSGISPKKGLHLTMALHKATIDVNEEGSEAATVTGVAAGVRIGGPLVSSFTADHPFLFFIRDTRNGLILFVGRASKL